MYQGLTPAQAELPLIGQVNAQVYVFPTDIVASWPTEQEAFRQCILRHPAKLTQGQIAENIGMGRANFVAIINSDYPGKLLRAFTRTKQIELQQECRCKCIDQWADLYDKGMLNCQRSKADRLAALNAEIEKLKEETAKLGGIEL